MDRTYKNNEMVLKKIWTVLDCTKRLQKWRKNRGSNGKPHSPWLLTQYVCSKLCIKILNTELKYRVKMLLGRFSRSTTKYDSCIQQTI